MNANILIENNTFKLWRGRAIYLRQTRDTLISNNRFLEPAKPAGVKPRKNDAAIVLEKSRDIELTDNKNESGLEELIKKNIN